MSASMVSQPTNLKEQWAEFRKNNPKVRIRDAAHQLGVSEAQLVATGCGETATRLEGTWRDVLDAVSPIGRVMALTRNEHAVHEKKGLYQGLETAGHVGLVHTEGIDLRIFFSRWKLGFVVSEDSGQAFMRHSLQFFDGAGHALHKIFLQPESNFAALDELVKRFRSDNQSPVQVVEPETTSKTIRPDADIDVQGLQQAWYTLKDTHDFFGMLRTFEVERTQAFRLVGADLARPVSTQSARQVLTLASEQEVSMMVFVGNPGIIQIHTGPVSKIVPYGDWINVMDPEFNLHLRETGIASAWIVRKPTLDGDVTSLELFDQDGNNIALFFGERKPGKPELQSWRNVLADVK